MYGEHDKPVEAVDPALEEEFATLVSGQAKAVKALDVAVAESRVASTSSGGSMRDRAAKHLKEAEEAVTIARDRVREFRAMYPDFEERDVM